MQRQSKFAVLALAASAAFGSFLSFPGHLSAGGLSIDINLGVPAPRVVHHDEVVVLEYDRYCVGARRDLYDADWRLRNAQIEQWHAQEALTEARQHEGEIAVTVEDQEAFVVTFGKRVAESDAALTAARAAVGRAQADADDARARLHAYEKRIQGAKDDLDAARTLHDGAAVEDAQKRIALNEAAAGAAAGDLRAAELRTTDLRTAEAAAAALNDDRVKLVDFQARLPRLREDFAVAHDAVFAAQQRLDAAIGTVALALHDRDEAMWMLHRDEILSGRATFASCGFTVDMGVWGGRMPRDPEVVHAYFVHPVAYWVERPVEIQTRVVECDRVVEITRVRTIQEKHEGPRFHEVVVFETNVPVERRREFAERVVVERQHFAAEKTERANAAAEHRAPRIPDTERAEAKAMVTKAHAEAKVANIEAKSEARTEITKAKADAKAEKIADHAEVQKAQADTRSEKLADRDEVNKAKADAKSEKVEAHADAKAEEIKAKGDAKSAKAEAHAEDTKAAADAKAKQTEAKADAKAKTTEAKADAKAKQTEAKADKKANTPPAGNTPSASDRKARDPRNPGSDPAADSRKTNNKDPRNKNKDDQASVDQR